MDEVLAFVERNERFTSSSSRILIYSTSISGITLDNANGIGMAFESSTITYLGVIGSTLKSLKASSGYYFGAGFYTNGIGATECRFTCFSKNLIYLGQSFYIKSSKDKSLSTDLTISQCPEKDSSIGQYGAFHYYGGTFGTEVSNTNISQSKLYTSGFLLWESNNGVWKTSYSTATGNVGNSVLWVNSNPTLTFTKMNIIGNQQKSGSNPLINSYSSSAKISFSDSIFIDNAYGYLSSNPVTITDSVFFNCSFSTPTSVTTAITKPFTWVPNYLPDPKWFPTKPSKLFTSKSKVNAFIVQTVFLVIPG